MVRLGDDFFYHLVAINPTGIPGVKSIPQFVSVWRGPRPYKPFSDAYFFAPSGQSIGLNQIAGQNGGSQSVQITAAPPVNALSTTLAAPLISPGVAIGSGGSLSMGTFFIQIFAYDSTGAWSAGSNIVIFKTTTLSQNATISVTFAAGTVGYEIFHGLDPNHFYASGQVVGSPSSIVLNSFTYFSYGPPDNKAVSYHARAKRSTHAGILGTTVASSTLTTVVVGMPGAPSVDQFAGRYLMVLSKSGLPTSQSFSLIPITGNDAGSPLCTITPGAPGTLTETGDLILITTSCTSATLTSITDTGWVSPFSAYGLEPGSTPAHLERGYQVMIIFDPNQTLPPGTVVDIKDNDGTTLFTTPFPSVPPVGTVFIVVEKSWRENNVSSIVLNSVAPTYASPNVSPVASLPIHSLSGEVALIQLLVQDVDGNDSQEVGDGLRLIYVTPPPTAGGPAAPYMVPVVAGIATPDASQGTNLLILTSDVHVVQPINYSSIAGIEVPWSLLIQQDPTGGTGGYTAIFDDGTYYIGVNLSSPASPTNTQCHVDLKTKSTGNTYLAGQPSVDQPIAS